YLVSVVRRKILGELARPGDSLLQARVAYDDVGQRSERWIGHHPAKVQFALEEGNVVLLDGILNRVMFGIKGLNEHAAGKVAASGAACDLGQQLKRPLRGAKIRQAQGGVSADPTDERDALKIVALGQHLRAHENIERAAGEGAERFLILALGSRRVAVQSRDAGTRKFLAQPFFKML